MRPRPPNTEPSPRSPPPLASALAMMRSAKRLKGMLCNHTVPDPRSVARNIPSPRAECDPVARFHSDRRTQYELTTLRPVPENVRHRSRIPPVERCNRELALTMELFAAVRKILRLTIEAIPRGTNRRFSQGNTIRPLPLRAFLCKSRRARSWDWWDLMAPAKRRRCGSLPVSFQ